MAFRIPGETAGEARFRQRVERSQKAQEAQDARRYERISRQVAECELQEKKRQRHEREMFDLYLLADTVLDRLEETRDRNAPKEPDAPWNEQFCAAVSVIPEVKMFLKDMSMAIIDGKR